MHAFIRSLAVTVVALLAAVILAVGSMLTPIFAAVATSATTALIMGGTGRPNPDDFPGYIPNVAQYYIYPNTLCQPTGLGCDLQAVYTPETAWPLYGGLNAPTWRNSILQGVDLFDDAVQEQLAGLGPDDHLVLFGYSQSGAILAYEKKTLETLTPEQKAQIEIVAIGNVSRPNGGLNSRAFPFSIPIVQFPFGPPMPTNTGINTTDIALQWDIIADAPLYITNPVAMLNALLGFWYVHGTYPDPTQADPTDTPGGYTTEQWQWLMDYPELYPDLVTVQPRGDGSDTTYITVKPTVLPLVQPLHDLGLAPLANLLEPALRVLVEETGYNRSIPYGQYTSFRLIPLFNPITLAVDLIKAIPQGVEQMLAGLRGEPTHIVPAPPETLLGGTGDTVTAAAPEAVKASARTLSKPTKAAPPVTAAPQDTAETSEAAVSEVEPSKAEAPQADVSDEEAPVDATPALTTAAVHKVHTLEGRLNSPRQFRTTGAAEDTTDVSTDATSPSQSNTSDASSEADATKTPDNEGRDSKSTTRSEQPQRAEKAPKADKSHDTGTSKAAA
ncbi:MAG: PE-PPE domain-containing protein [Mycobacterium sp.]